MSINVSGEWRPVVGYEGLYEVSSLGQVQSLTRLVRRRDGNHHLRRGATLKLDKDRAGYRRVQLSKDSVVKHHLVHRLVATAFLRKSDPFHNVVNHLNGCKSDNSASNLEWTTHAGNLAHAMETGANKLSGSDHHQARLTEKLVQEIRALYENCGYTQKDLAEKFQVSPSTIYLIVHRKRWRHI